MRGRENVNEAIPGVTTPGSGVGSLIQLNTLIENWGSQREATLIRKQVRKEIWSIQQSIERRVTQ